MATQIEYAQLSTSVYEYTDRNSISLPSGWRELPDVPSTAYGFRARAYTNGSEVVISFEGTGPDKVDWLTNVLAGAGNPFAPQLHQAALFYQRIKATYGGNISFTGHSLGGGLASAMAVLFDRPATIFAPAPFQPFVTNYTSVLAVNALLAAHGYSDADLNRYMADPLSFLGGLPGSEFHRRESVIHSYSIEGEALGAIRTSTTAIEGHLHPIEIGNSALGAVDRHAMTLHLAMLASTRFQDAAKAIPAFLPLLADKSLFANDPRTPNRDLLNHLLRHQMGVRDANGQQILAPDGMLDRLTNDLERLAPLGVALGQETRQTGLIALALQYYYEIDGTRTLQSDFFSSVTGGLRFDLTQVGGGDPTKVKGIANHLGKLINAELTSDIQADLRRYANWNVQIGDQALEASGTGAGDLLLGGNATADQLAGGGGADLLIGGGGDDTLNGGADNDILLGGFGMDTYRYASGDGRDTLTDYDGLGRILINDITLTGGVAGTRYRTWRDEEHKIDFRFVGAGSASRVGQLIISGEGLGGAGNEIVIQNYTLPEFGQAGPLGLTFERKPKLELLKGTVSANPYADYAHQAGQGVMADITEGLARSFTLAVSAASDAVQTIRLSLGALADKFKAVLGDDIVSFAGGEVRITLQPGQTLTSFALIASGDIDDDAAIELTATLVQDDPQADAVSNSLTLNLDAEEEPDWAGDAFDRTIVGDMAPIDFDPDQPGVQGRTDELGNLLTDRPEPGRADTLYDSAGADRIDAGDGADTIIAYRGGNDLLDGGGNNDKIDAGAGDDRVLGGAGADVLRGQAGDDRLEGGEDADFLYGGEGDDKLLAEADLTLEEAIAQGGSGPGSSDWGDFLQGNEGRDTVIGGAARDLLGGGAGEDILVGGAGDDLLSGDDEYSAIGYDWSVERTVESDPDGTTTYHYTVNGVSGTEPAGASDALYGGAGDDWLFGNEGDDFIDGGADNDVAFGEEGADTLLGGEGNDVLVGDASVEAIAEALHGDDFLDGGAGDDEINGDGGSDILYGGEGDDKLYGDSAGIESGGDDYLDGEDGNDVLLGAGGDDLIYGGEGNDQLFGDSDDTDEDDQGDDALYGEGGNDQLQGYRGDDYLDGGEGDDIMFGGLGQDVLYGGSGDDELVGDDGDDDPEDEADSLYGEEGNDRLFGGSGDDYLAGGEGDDILVGAAGGDTLEGGDGDDAMLGDNGTDVLAAGLHGDDVLSGGAGNDMLEGGGGSDTLFGDEGDDTLYGDSSGIDSGADYLSGGAGNDFLMGGADADTLDGGDGDDQLHGDAADVPLAAQGDDALSGGAGNDLLSGYAGNDSLDGGDGNDILYGGDGDDYLNGGMGADVLEGGLGYDVIEDPDGNDIYIYSAGDGGQTINDGGGDDLLILRGGLGFNAIHLGLGSLLISDGIAGDEIHIEGFDPNDVAGCLPIERIRFSDGQEMSFTELIAAIGFEITGTPDADDLSGTSANDTITALAGDDFVIAGDGNDAIDLGEGDDYADAGAGNDTIHAGAGSDWVSGSEGNDAIDGGAGADTMVGGAGNDSYAVDDAGDLIVEAEDEGSDSVVSGVDYALSGNVENLRLTGAAVAGIGNALDNVIEGNGLANLLDGAGGADLLVGGAGDDVYLVDDDGDVVQEEAGAGADTVLSGVSHTLGAHVENLVLTGSDASDGTGNAADNVLTGNDAGNGLYGGAGNDILIGAGGDDYLDGGTGADGMSGGDGNDEYFVDDSGDVVAESADGGIDGVVASIDYTLADNLEDLQLANPDNGIGPWPVMGRGNDLNNWIEGNDADNRLYGGGGDDVLMDDYGSDLLDGGAGADVMSGGIWSDTYIVDDAGDTVIETDSDAWWGGYDRVQAGVDFTLSDNVEALYLTGSADLAGHGNELSNYIEGNSGANALYGLGGADVLDGGAGADRMTGGEGDDTYFVDDDGDVTLESAGEGHDSVYASATHALGENIEDLHLTGGENIDGTGNDLDNLIVGNEADNDLGGLGGNDVIDGGAGEDVMRGGAGDDTYSVDNLDDRVVELADEGIDSVVSNASHILSDNVENLRLSGDFADGPYVESLSGTGNALANVIEGNDGDNELYGLDGADHVDGRAGNDLIDGGTDDDILYGGDDAVYRGNEEEGGESGYGGSVLASNSDEIHGGEGGDSIDGGSGEDYLYGDEGDDVIYGGDDGLYVDSPWGGYEGEGGYGGLFLGNDDYIEGGAGNDDIDGGSGNDALYGGDGEDVLFGGYDGPLNTTNDDYLDGGAGIDTLAGGTGDDVYVVDGEMELLPPPPPPTGCDIGSGDDEPEPTYRTVADTVIEYAGEGYDVVYSSVSLVLPENVEALIFTGSANIDVVGNEDANFILGNAGNNIVNGGGGDDTMAGGEGDDTYYVDSEQDEVVEEAGAGTDTVRAYIEDYSLGDNLENLDLTNGVATGFGNALDNRIRGNAADNFLYGAGGNDRLAGAGGNDVLDGGDGDDAYFFGLGGGQDTVSDSSGNDRVVLVNGLNPSNVTLSRSGSDLVIGVAGGDDRLTLSDWFNPGRSIETIRFCGGPAFTRDDIIASLDNDAPAAVDDFAEVQEDVVLVADGNVLDNDDDDAGIAGVANPGTQVGAYGTLTLAADGSFAYSLDNAAVQSLGEGQSVSEAFVYRITDGDLLNPLSAQAVLTVNVRGNNDAPIAVDDANAVQEDVNVTAGGNVLMNDSDIDRGTVLVVADAGVRQGAYGTLGLAQDGSFTYALDNASPGVQSLAAWETVVDTFAYGVTDGLVASAGSVAVTVAGSNDAPVAASPLADQAARVGQPLSYQFAQSAFTDIDHGDSLTYGATLADGSALPSWLSFDAATRTFSGTPASGNVGLLSLHVVAHDRMGAAASQDFGIEVTGGNLPPVTAPDCNHVSEDCRLIATGNVLSNDSDPDGTVLSVSDFGTRTGAYGTLTLGSDGGYRYVLNNASSAVQSLGVGETVLDRFTYGASDGLSTTRDALTVSIAGRNDIPLLVKPLADRQFKKNSDFQWSIPAGSFTDIDRNDRLSYTAQQANGCALPNWLRFDAATRTFSGHAPANAGGSVDIRVVARDGHGADSYAADVFRVSFATGGGCGKGNEGVGNGEDPPPPGHDDNWNDGPGTGPGHPASQGGGSHGGEPLGGSTPAQSPACRDEDDWLKDWGRGGGVPHGDSACLDLNRIDGYRDLAADAGRQGRESDDGYLRRWAEMEARLARHLADSEGDDEWAQACRGADPRGLQMLAGGDRITLRGGCDPLVLNGAMDSGLRGFRGLQEGIERLG